MIFLPIPLQISESEHGTRPRRRLSPLIIVCILSPVIPSRARFKLEKPLLAEYSVLNFGFPVTLLRRPSILEPRFDGSDRSDSKGTSFQVLLYIETIGLYTWTSPLDYFYFLPYQSPTFVTPLLWQHNPSLPPPPLHPHRSLSSSRVCPGRDAIRSLKNIVCSKRVQAVFHFLFLPTHYSILFAFLPFSLGKKKKNKSLIK